jgi:hypothetical protein
MITLKKNLAMSSETFQAQNKRNKMEQNYLPRIYWLTRAQNRKAFTEQNGTKWNNIISGRSLRNRTERKRASLLIFFMSKMIYIRELSFVPFCSACSEGITPTF